MKAKPAPAENGPAHYKKLLTDPARVRELGLKLAAIALHRVTEKVTTRRLGEARRMLEFLAAARAS